VPPPPLLLLPLPPTQLTSLAAHFHQHLLLLPLLPLLML
jgi:hypothetical protein